MNIGRNNLIFIVVLILYACKSTHNIKSSIDLVDLSKKELKSKTKVSDLFIIHLFEDRRILLDSVGILKDTIIVIQYDYMSSINGATPYDEIVSEVIYGDKSLFLESNPHNTIRVYTKRPEYAACVENTLFNFLAESKLDKLRSYAKEESSDLSTYGDVYITIYDFKNNKIIYNSSIVEFCR